MAKFELLGIEMSTKVSVIPTSTKLCVKAVKAQNAQDRMCDELHSLLREFSSDKDMRSVIEGLLSNLSVIHDFVQPIVNALEEDDEESQEVVF